jgi:hypothetical protein
MKVMRNINTVIKIQDHLLIKQVVHTVTNGL